MGNGFAGYFCASNKNLFTSPPEDGETFRTRCENFSGSKRDDRYLLGEKIPRSTQFNRVRDKYDARHCNLRGNERNRARKCSPTISVSFIIESLLALPMLVLLLRGGKTKTRSLAVVARNCECVVFEWFSFRSQSPCGFALAKFELRILLV